MVAMPESYWVSPEAYLLQERDAETKSEYYDGVIVAMAGGSLPHVTISSNAHFEIQARLKGGSCRAFTSEMRVRVAKCNRYFYPDVSVVCGERIYEQFQGVQSLTNPTVIVEVLSDSTEAIDRGDKMRCYRTLPSLAVYLLISQEKPIVEWYDRQADDSWRHTILEGLDECVRLSALNIELPLAELYADVVFPPPLAPPSERESEPPSA